MQCTELSCMSSKRCYVATAVLHDRWSTSSRPPVPAGCLLWEDTTASLAFKLLRFTTQVGALHQTFVTIPPATNQWSPLPDMIEVRSDLAAVTFNDKVFAIGGFNGTEALRSIEFYDPEEKQWLLCPNLRTPRSAAR